MTRVLLIILLAILSSCNSNTRWIKFEAKGLPDKDDHYNDILFINDSTGYLSGDRTVSTGKSRKQDQFINKTVLYNTRDRGQSWSKLPIDYKGSIDKIFSFNDTLIAIVRGGYPDTNHILKSVDRGSTWTDLLSIDKESYVREINFRNSNEGFVVIDDSTAQFFLKFYNGKWDTLQTLPFSSKHKILKDQIVSLIQSDSVGLYNGAVVRDLNSTKETKLLFDKRYYISSTKNYNNDLYLSVKDNDINKIVKISNNQIQSIDLGDYSDFVLQELFVYDKTIMAIAYQRKDVAFLGIIKSLLISNDYGKSWTLEELPNSMSPLPAFLYKDRFFISSCLPPGFIQIRE